MLNILTVDFEEWYHAEYVQDKASKREDFAPSDLASTLDLFQKYDTSATFFVVGELARKYPQLLSQIAENGHEVAFHAYYHEPLRKKSPQTFKQEIEDFKVAIGRTAKGFRAPSFSLDEKAKWVLGVLEDTGFKYDSSIFPVKTPLYGVPEAPLEPYKPSHYNIALKDDTAQLWEFPLHVYSLPLLRVPMAGGFYLRFFPISLIKKSIENANKKGRPAVIYAHTWELGSNTPRQKLGYYRSFVTYHNLDKTSSRLGKLLSKFEFCSIENYMKEEGLT
jgi:polysaccharide deacetylase family protein (PEP-CTERM system associated)